MTKRLQDVRAEARISNSPLSARLRSISVEPIPRELVEAHMEQELRKAPPSTVLGRFIDRRGWSKHPFDNMVRIMLFGLCVCGIGAAALCELAHDSRLWNSGAALKTATVAFLVSIAAGAAFYWFDKYSSFICLTFARGEARWITIPTAGFYFPPFTEERMWLVERFIPDARFEIADLRQNHYSLDPILFVVLDGEREAICVWKHYNEETHLI